MIISKKYYLIKRLALTTNSITCNTPDISRTSLLVNFSPYVDGKKLGGLANKNLSKCSQDGAMG